MNTETKPQKESKLDIDSNYDLRLVRTLSPALRWVLALPIAFLAALVIQITCGFFIKPMLSNFAEDGAVSVIVNSAFMLMKYCAFIVTAVATSPVARSKKFTVSIVFAIIASCLCAGSTVLALSFGSSDNKTMMMATGTAAIAGALLAVWNVRNVTSMPASEGNKNPEL